MNDLSQKIADKQQSLQQSVQNISSRIVESASNMDTNIAISRSALDIVDEMADRELRSKILVVYNFQGVQIVKLTLMLSRFSALLFLSLILIFVELFD